VRGKRVAVLVAGGIAAYKVADMVSQLVQAGCLVRVAMTPAAQRFVGPTTFHGVSGQPVLTELWSGTGEPEPHVELGDWAQVVLLAPATADVLAKIAHGLADDAVTATVLAARAPLVVAPAMNDAMWANPAVAQNVDTIRRRGVLVLEPESGHLASGHVGAGRLAGAAAVFAGLDAALRAGHDLAGKRVVVSAGGTREPIDSVRFISNYSSGKMGFAVAQAAADRGAEVVLVTTTQHLTHAGIRTRSVETAAEMLAALREELPGAHLLVMAAAIADFRPGHPVAGKIRREERDSLHLELEKVEDLVASLAREPGAEGTYRVGFAAEGEDMEASAQQKLERKGLDAIVANDISRTDIGFGSDHNEAVVFFRDGSRADIPRMPKREFADRMLDLVTGRLE
jgi:phosphopantothenoylcysteine decarboxylase/phosphopantothenate--cysteine ligase